MNNSELYKLWDEFLALWPVHRIEAMTLEEYTRSGDPDSFMNWVEFRTKPLATISGSSSFIFGIYSRKDQSAKSNTKNNIYEDQYAWRASYGKTKEEAFQHVKTQILLVINAIKNNNISQIEEIDLIKTVKWKIAFLYQDRNDLKIIPTFAEQRLRYFTGVGIKDKDFKLEDAYRKLISEKGEQDLFEFNDVLTQKYLVANPKDKFNTQIAYDYMHERYPTFEKTAEYLFVIENKFGVELALETTEFNKSAPRIFIKFKPPESIYGLNIVYKSKDKRSNSTLDSTKTLKNNSEFFQVAISQMNQLVSICDWWDVLGGRDNMELVNEQKNNGNDMKKIPQSLNRILFGAAGTGKTFHTINHALSIIENKSLELLENEDRAELKKRFDDYKDQGQIKFVTFHQSFSYEDFVEGIRAETDKQGQLRYDVKAGVFKNICDQSKKIDNNQEITQVSQPIEFGKGYILKKMNTELLEIQKPNGNVIHLSRVLTEFLLREFRNGKITDRNLAEKKVIEILGESEILEPYLVNGYSAIWANLIPFLDNLLYSEKPVVKEKSKYVIIIDEINRGNISRIFGELITLIEDSKRQEAEEALSVTLPYSKEEFSVPNNVFIIGTMNSSDRSLTGLDIALRRRFTFIEIPPQPKEIKYKNGELIKVFGKDKNGNDKQVIVANILSVMNQRIEVLLDRDHCIGHANFMSLKKQPTLEHLASIFKQKIIPQLQEYFFDDWAKINMVLNANGMLKPQSVERSLLFPNVDTESDGFFEEQKTWQLVDATFDSIDSFAKIIKH